MSLTDTLISHHQNNVLGHAYLIEGDKNSSAGEVYDFLKNYLGVSVNNDPDVARSELETLKIENARALKEQASMRPRGKEGRKFFIVSFDFTTTEAQNSLLKLFEEPASDTHFFIITPNADILLPTLFSRLAHINNKEHTPESSKVSATDFLSSTPPKRMELLGAIIKNKDKSSAISLLNEVEKNIYENLKMSEMNESTSNALKELHDCRTHLYRRAPSVKMILEHLSLVIPKK